jgi:hypothetical protein
MAFVQQTLPGVQSFWSSHAIDAGAGPLTHVPAHSEGGNTPASSAP